MTPPTEHMSPDEFAHHTASVCGTLGWTLDGNAIIGPNGKRMEWPGDLAVGCAVTRLPWKQRIDYGSALPCDTKPSTWTWKDRLRAFSAAVGRPWGGAK